MRKTESGFELSTKALTFLVLLVGLLSTVAAMALSYATTVNTIDRKLDRDEYIKDVARLTMRMSGDSIRAEYDRRGIADIKANTEEINRRLTQFICSRSKQEYCR